jgi:hypothetical protein
MAELVKKNETSEVSKRKEPPPGIKDPLSTGKPPEGADLKGQAPPPKMEAGLEPVGPTIDAYLQRISDERVKRKESVAASAPKPGEKVPPPRVNGPLFPGAKDSNAKDTPVKFKSVPSKWS